MKLRLLLVLIGALGPDPSLAQQLYLHGQCRMDSCVHIQIKDVRQLGSLGSGTLISFDEAVEIAACGRGVYPNYKAAPCYLRKPPLLIYERNFAFCSYVDPTVLSPTKQAVFSADYLNPAAQTPGYQIESTLAYLAACHQLVLSPEDLFGSSRSREIAALGYRTIMQSSLKDRQAKNSFGSIEEFEAFVSGSGRTARAAASPLTSTTPPQPMTTSNPPEQKLPTDSGSASQLSGRVDAAVSALPTRTGSPAKSAEAMAPHPSMPTTPAPGQSVARIQAPISSTEFMAFLQLVTEKGVMCSEELSTPSRNEMEQYSNVVNELIKYPPFKSMKEHYDQRPRDRSAEQFVRLAARDILMTTCATAVKELAERSQRIQSVIAQVGGHAAPPSDASCGSGGSAPGSAPGTKFRGLFINMPRSEIEQWTLPDFDLRVQQCQASVNSKDHKKCAEISIGADGRVEKLEFAKCFFGASDLGPDAFMQRIVDNYRIPHLNCEQKSIYVPDIRDSVVTKECAGSALTGEWVSIVIRTAGILGGTIEMTVSRRAISHQPKFD
jgi:hypothetical protein